MDIKKNGIITIQPAKLVLENVAKKFSQGTEQIEVLKNISVTFLQGKTYAITGFSGSGKSTLMHIIAGLDIPDHGNVLFNTVILSKLSINEKNLFLNRSIGLVFQFPYLIKELSVIENVMIPGLIRSMSYSQCKEIAFSLLEQVGIADKATHSPRSLSGGQQQRVALARALYNKPLFLLADEPTGNLDVSTGRKIIDLLCACQKEWGMGIIISSHDAYVSKAMESIYELQSGILTKII